MPVLTTSKTSSILISKRFGAWSCCTSSEHAAPHRGSALLMGIHGPSGKARPSVRNDP
jgi:hypothetical protein